MTAGAVVAALDVICRFAGGCCVIVTANACPIHIIMINLNRRLPSAVAVAILTQIGCVHMGRALAGDRIAIMAAGATAVRIVMVKVGGYPAGRGMADETILRNWDVIRIDAGSRGAVVAAVTGTLHMRVIDLSDGQPTAVAVTILADIGGLDVGGILAREDGAVVTAETSGRDCIVSESRRYPTRSGMAGLTVIAAGDVVGTLAGGRDIVMATETSPYHFQVIDADYWYPLGIAVAGLAYSGG